VIDLNVALLRITRSNFKEAYPVDSGGPRCSVPGRPSLFAVGRGRMPMARGRSASSAARDRNRSTTIQTMIPNKISHPVTASPDSRSTASQIEFTTGTATQNSSSGHHLHHPAVRTSATATVATLASELAITVDPATWDSKPYRNPNRMPKKPEGRRCARWRPRE
jgi:hypothetical protein